MKNTLEKRIILFSFIILFCTILANSSMDIAGFRKDYITALILRSQSLGVSLRSSVEKVVALGLDVKEIEGLNEKCRELVQANPEIAYCIISDLEGKPLYWNDPALAATRFDLINRSIRAGAEQRTNLIGLDTLYYDTVTPIHSPYGKQVALVHIGFAEKIISAKVAAIILRSAAILVVFFLASFTLVIFFVKKSIVQPVSALLKGVKSIAEGNLDTRIQPLPVYEFDTVAKNINNMSASLQNRQEEIRTNYKQLEKAHGELHDSFYKLESLRGELEKSEELYKSLMEEASDAIVVIGDDEVVKIANKMAEEMFGYSASSITGSSFARMLQMLKVEDVPLIYGLLQKALAGKHVEEEMVFMRQNGERVVGRIHANSIKSGSKRLVQAIVRDVTKEHEILRNLEKSAADLARLNKMKDSFLGLASHELKTPLTVIMGYSELIITNMPDKIDKTVLAMVENISNAAARLDGIVKDMVDVSMIEEKKLQLKFEDIDLNRLVEACISELRFFFSLRKQEIVAKLDETLPLIKGDRVRLMQLLSNVLGNAIKFTPDGGKITVASNLKYLMRSSHNARAGTPNSNDREHHAYVEVTIADTGIGIDREDHLRIFEKFYEVGNIEEHSTGKVAFKGKGAGLGLAIAKGIVTMHGGEIWVESPGFNPQDNPGSTFHILLPVHASVNDMSVDYLNLFN